MATSSKRKRRLWDAYAFPRFRPQPTVRGVFGDPKARVITLVRRSKKRLCGCCGRAQSGWYDRRTRQVRDLSCGDTRIYLEFEVRRVQCQELRQGEARAAGVSGRQPVLYQALCPLRGPALPFDHDQGLGQGAPSRLGHGQDPGEAVHAAQLAKAGTPGPKAIGIDEISIRKGHSYRIVVSDLMRAAPDLVRRRRPLREAAWPVL